MSESLLNLDAVIARVGFKSSKIYHLIAAGEFPAPIKIGSASRWPSSTIDEWIARQVQAHRQAGASAD